MVWLNAVYSKIYLADFITPLLCPLAVVCSGGSGHSGGLSPPGPRCCAFFPVTGQVHYSEIVHAVCCVVTQTTYDVDLFRHAVCDSVLI